MTNTHTLQYNDNNKFSLHVCMLSSLVMSNSFHPVDCSPPGFPVHEIFQARKLEWVAISFSGGSDFPNSGIEPTSLSLAGSLYHYATWEAPTSSSLDITMIYIFSLCGDDIKIYFLKNFQYSHHAVH